MRIWTLALTLVLTLPSAVLVAVEVGEPAPPLADITWVKNGAPPEDRQWTVVEFWATWCPPCIESIPHLTELHHEYDELTVIGLSEEAPATIEPFIERMGEDMDYHVGSAGPSVMPKWEGDVISISLPIAFLISPDGQVVWYGHTVDLEAQVVKALAGTIDLERNRKLSALETELGVAVSGRRLADIDAVTRKILAVDPTHPRALVLAGMVASQVGDPRRFRELVARVDPSVVDATGALDIANYLLTQQHFVYRNLDIAVPLAEYVAAELPDDPRAQSTLARSHYLLGRIDAAIAAQERALDLMADASADERIGIEVELAYYREVATLADAPAPAPEADEAEAATPEADRPKPAIEAAAPEADKVTP